MQGVDVEARVPEDETGDDLSTLYVRSSSMMAGYLGPQGLDRSQLEEDWFNTGDLARLGPDAGIHLRGRVTEVVNVGGLKVVPREVEDVIAGLPGVDEVKVYAGLSPAGSQFVKTAVVANGNLDEAAVRAHCKRQLIYYKRPSVVHLVHSLPKTPSGKVVLDQLP
jgi:acyl-CoA synthetase (AMP-forming)/AMP-acid ligase II